MVPVNYNQEVEKYFKRIKRYWNLFNMSASFGDNLYILRTIESELRELFELLNQYYGSINEITLSNNSTDELLTLTSEELSTYNGKKGKDAFVAVEGIVYDVSSSRSWQNGEHFGIEAGTDVTEALKKCHGGVALLKRFTKVGRLVD